MSGAMRADGGGGGTPLVSLRGVAKAFKSGTLALENVNLDVRAAASPRCCGSSRD
jgi:hypothetical protein